MSIVERSVSVTVLNGGVRTEVKQCLHTVGRSVDCGANQCCVTIRVDDIDVDLLEEEPVQNVPGAVSSVQSSVSSLKTQVAHPKEREQQQ
eukprot:m.131083 g.131083  ORF g.131083 m.131083 type:complete len:90 (+) comp52360_c1_seq6:3-272(+)